MMTRRLNRRGTVSLALVLGTVFSAVLFVGAQQSTAPASVRGNVPGEWRWGVNGHKNVGQTLVRPAAGAD